MQEGRYGHHGMHDFGPSAPTSQHMAFIIKGTSWSKMASETLRERKIDEQEERGGGGKKGRREEKQKG